MAKTKTSIKLNKLVPKNRKPTHPGEVLKEEFLIPANMTQTELAKKLGLQVQQVNALVHGRRDFSVKLSVKLSRVFKTTPEFWMCIQISHDIWHELRHNSK